MPIYTTTNWIYRLNPASGNRELKNNIPSLLSATTKARADLGRARRKAGAKALIASVLWSHGSLRPHSG